MNKKIRLIILVIFCVSNTASAQYIDSIACKKFEDTLLVIKKAVLDLNSDPQMHRINAIHFLQKTTKIRSTSPVSFIGPEMPSQKDYDSWHCWYLQNKYRLRWDLQKQIIYLADNFN